MVSYLPLGVLLLAATAYAKTPFIVGGQDTRIERYPSLVQVEYLYPWMGSWDQQCGATILTSSWILSAAHCFDGAWYSRQNTRIRAGATYRHTGGSVHYVDFERNHPDYGRATSNDADISVIRLRTPLVFTNTIQRGTIVIQGTILPDNYPVVHAGWGTTQFLGNPSHVLQDVTINVINRNLCAQRYGGNTVTANMICAGLLNVGGRDACQGDSGGPMYAGTVIVGVVSFGNGCGDYYYPGVSTQVSSYTSWILANAR